MPAIFIALNLIVPQTLVSRLQLLVNRGYDEGWHMPLELTCFSYHRTQPWQKDAEGPINQKGILDVS